MQKIVCLWVCLLGLSWSAQGQSAAPACGSGRYVSDVFSAVSKTSGIEYGQNLVVDYGVTPNTTTNKILVLDFYEPTDDTELQRPLLLFAFGGAFVTGNRADMDDLCRAFALKGYATATIDYRLIAPNSYGAVAGNPALLADQIVRASSDMKAAVRFFRHDAAKYHIDPNRIIVAGYSAGAITALQTAYIDSETEDPTYTAAYQNNGGLEGNTDLPAPNNLLPSYNARNLTGVFNLAGGVATLAVVSAGNPPLFSVHGDADQTVPYGYGPVYPAYRFPYSLYGSGAMQPQATSAGVTNQLLTLPGGTHPSPRATANRTAINDAAAAFFQPLICAAPLPVTLTSFSGRVAPDDCTATLGWQTATERNSYAYEVQGSADGQAFAALGTLPSRNRVAGASYSFRVGRLAELHYFRLRMLDTDGTAAYSPVVTLAGCGAGPLLVAPTPTRDLATVSGLPAGRCLGVLYSATGQAVAQVSGTATISLRLGSLPPGIYLLKVLGESGATVGTAKVVKE